MPDLSNYILTVIFGLISAGLLAFCKYLSSQIKDYKRLLENRENVIIEETIAEKLKPIQEEIAKLKAYIEEIDAKEENLTTKTIAAWGFRIQQLCDLYLKQGYMERQQYLQLVEMYSLYSQLGGNGKVEEIFTKTKEDLPIRD